MLCSSSLKCLRSVIASDSRQCKDNKEQSICVIIERVSPVDATPSVVAPTHGLVRLDSGRCCQVRPVPNAIDLTECDVMSDSI